MPGHEVAGAALRRARRCRRRRGTAAVHRIRPARPASGAARDHSASRPAAARSAATANATAPATFWVPLRRSRSWPPPTSCGWSGTPSRTTRAPTPFGPAALVRRQRHEVRGRRVGGDVEPRQRLRRRRCGAARSGARSRTTAAIAASGWTVPTSLLTSSDGHERHVLVERGRPAGRGRRRRVASTGTVRPPARSTGWSTAWCSAALHTTVPGRAPEHAADGEVVGLGAAAGEHDLAGPAPDDRGQPAPGLVELGRACRASAWRARRVAEALGQQRDERSDGLGPGRAARGMVEEVPVHAGQSRIPPRPAHWSGGRLRRQHLRRPLRRRVRRLVRRRHRRSRLHGPGGGAVADGRRRPGPRARRRVGPPRPPAGRAGPRGARHRRVGRRWSSGSGPSPAATRVQVTIGDMADLDLPDPPEFAVVLVAFNTFFNLATEADQRRCLERVATAAGARAAGSCSRRSCPMPSAADGIDGALTPRHISADEVVLSVSQRDRAAQTITGQHVHVTEAGIRLRPWHLRYATPRSSWTTWPPRPACSWPGVRPAGRTSRSRRERRPRERVPNAVGSTRDPGMSEPAAGGRGRT